MVQRPCYKEAENSYREAGLVVVISAEEICDQLDIALEEILDRGYYSAEKKKRKVKKNHFIKEEVELAQWIVSQQLMDRR